MTRGQAQEIVDAARVGGDRLNAIGFFVGECDRGGVDGVALRVEHAALDARAILRECRNGEN